MRRPCRQGGFTLIEALVALALLAVALLLGMGLMVQQPAVVRRVDAHREALRSIEGTLEALRAGQLPLVSTRLAGPAVSVGSQPSAVAVWIEVTPVSPPGLHEVVVRARYPAAGRIVERQVQTLVFRPPPPGGPSSPGGR